MEVDLKGGAEEPTAAAQADAQAVAVEEAVGVDVVTPTMTTQTTSIVSATTPPPRLVSVTVHKNSADAVVGVGLVDKFGMTIINSIKPGGLCYNSSPALQVGMRVYSINGLPVNGGRDAAVGMLKVAVGDLTIVAGPPGLVQVHVTKPSPNSKVGLRFKHGDRAIHKQGDIVVAGVSDLFAATDIKVGMAVVSINGVECEGKHLDDVVDIIAKSDKTVSVLAYDKEQLNPKKLLPGDKTPPGLATTGQWGSTTYVGPITIGLAFPAIFTVVGWIFILLLCPCDRIDVYALNGKLYLPNGEFYKSQSDRNFEIRKSEHLQQPLSLKKGNTGHWGTTSYIGPLSAAIAIVSIPTIIGPLICLLFFPMDQRDVYCCNGALYKPNGDFYKSATELNFTITQSKHVGK